MADIDDKLGKSLDDLIKEASKKRQGTVSSSAGRSGRRSTSASRKKYQRSEKNNGTGMDVDEGGVQRSALGTSGGVGKVRISISHFHVEVLQATQ